MDTVEIAQKISLLRLVFQGLDDDELQEMAALSRFCTYPPEHLLCREGAQEDVFYIIANGSVLITQKVQDAEEERILREGRHGEVIGEMALIQNTPRSASVRTTTECTTLEMNKTDFEAILSRSPRLALDIIRITLDRIRANDQLAIDELQRTNKILQQLDRNKLDFIQVAAHELRTPLTVLKGYVDFLGSFPSIQAESTLVGLLEGMSKGADRMYEVVNMMLDVSRMDAETLKIVPVPVPIKQTVNILVEEMNKVAKERSIEITAQHAENTPIIQGDPEMVEKALYHLIINAIKYTPDGGKVSVNTRKVQMEANMAGAEIEVRDAGIGLDPEHHELVFEKFYQVGSVALHSSGKAKFKGGGPGLGLAIVRGVARAHGGKVWVESIGHDEINFPGSTFYLQLPLDPPAR